MYRETQPVETLVIGDANLVVRRRNLIRRLRGRTAPGRERKRMARLVVEDVTPVGSGAGAVVCRVPLAVSAVSSFVPV
jgi:hypothetical protein